MSAGKRNDMPGNPTDNTAIERNCLMNTHTKQELIEKKIIAIIRGITEEHLPAVIDALIVGGIHCIEITLNTPNALKMIQFAKESYGSKITVGAGTVLDKTSAVNAVNAGADFILSPLLDLEVIEVCHAYSKTAVPGVTTPTEAFTAWKAGADIVKLFPAASLGADYLKNLMGPLNNLDIMAVGGITSDNIKLFYEAGASCFGIGNELVNSRLAGNGDFQIITETARKLCSIR